MSSPLPEKPSGIPFSKSANTSALGGGDGTGVGSGEGSGEVEGDADGDSEGEGVGSRDGVIIFNEGVQPERQKHSSASRAIVFFMVTLPVRMAEHLRAGRFLRLAD